MPKAKQRDPNKPKRALTGFMFYSKERRQMVMQENPDMKFVDIGKKLGDEWKAMSKEAKQPYEDLAVKDKERYKGAMGKFSSASLPFLKWRRGVLSRSALTIPFKNQSTTRQTKSFKERDLAEIPISLSAR